MCHFAFYIWGMPGLLAAPWSYVCRMQNVCVDRKMVKKKNVVLKKAAHVV